MRSTEAKFFTNDDIVEAPAYMVGEPGLIEVEVADEDELALHFRHVNDTSAMISGYLTRAEALGLAHAITAAVVTGKVGAEA